MSAATKQFIPQFKDVNHRDGSGTLVVASLNVIDHDGDVTLPGFFGRQTVSLVPAHNHTHVPLGKGRIYEVGNEALCDFAFNLKIGAARDWFEAIVFDFENPPALQEYSYGFRTYQGGARSGTHHGQKVQFLQPRPDGSPGALVFEVSPVMLGAGIDTRTVAVNGVPFDGGKTSSGGDCILINGEVLLLTDQAKEQAEVEQLYLRSVATMNGIRIPSPEQVATDIGRRHGLIP